MTTVFFFFFFDVDAISPRATSRPFRDASSSSSIFTLSTFFLCAYTRFVDPPHISTNASETSMTYENSTRFDFVLTSNPLASQDFRDTLIIFSMSFPFRIWSTPFPATMNALVVFRRSTSHTRSKIGLEIEKSSFPPSSAASTWTSNSRHPFSSPFSPFLSRGFAGGFPGARGVLRFPDGFLFGGTEDAATTPTPLPTRKTIVAKRKRLSFFLSFFLSLWRTSAGATDKSNEDALGETKPLPFFLVREKKTRQKRR